jgi:hypothetical protein
MAMARDFNRILLCQRSMINNTRHNNKQARAIPLDLFSKARN